MRVVLPTPITDDQFISSTIAETEYSAYNNGTTYNQYDRVILDHVIYEALAGPGGSNVGHNPTGNGGDSWWVEVGPTSMWAMFDNEVNSQSTSLSNTMTVVIKPGDFVTDVVLLDAYATSAVITMTDGEGGPTVFTTTVDLDETKISDWLEYYYSGFKYATQRLITGLPLYVNGVITLELTHDSDTYCALGAFIVGTSVELGDVIRESMESGSVDYSRIEANDFGTVKIVRRKAAKTMSVTTIFPKQYAPLLHQILTDLRGTPAVYVGVPDGGDPYSMMTVFGLRKDFRVKPDFSATQATCSMDIMGFV